MRTDNNNNPAAVTTDVAAMGLIKCRLLQCLLLP